MKELKETHQHGMITIENKNLLLNPDNPFGNMIIGDLGIQIAKDGRIWLCIDGVAFIRFKPTKKKGE